MKNMILAATGDRDALGVIRDAFADAAKVSFARDVGALRQSLTTRQHDFLFIDLDMLSALAEAPDNPRGYLLGLKNVWRMSPSASVVVLSGHDRVRCAVDAVRHGAGYFLTYPLNQHEAQYAVECMRELRQLESELMYLRGRAGEGERVIAETRNSAMRQALGKVKVVAGTHSLVLLTGETGTGKSMFARLIHELSARSEKQFISVHCGAIPDTLIESELFGHEKGAFTGAVRRKPGKFEIAGEGSLFLDEIGAISRPMQIKLLQVLQERSFQRVGGEAELCANARIIVASNEDLAAMVEAGTFRRDLYYRLNVFPIEIPPLRQRREDIPILVKHFLRRLSREYGKEIVDAHPHAMEAFLKYDWPGNVRELENLVERAFILEQSNILTPESFPTQLYAEGAVAPLTVSPDMTLAEAREEAKENAERQYLKTVLGECGGRINKTAERAGITTRQLHKLLTKYGIHKEEYK